MLRLDRLVRDLAGVSTTLLDTNACVYYLNEHEPWATVVRVILERADRGQIAVSIPTIVQLELVAHAFKNDDDLERRRITAFVEGTHFIKTISLDRAVMLTSAEIRGRLGLKVADSIVLGSACVAGVDAVVGNDARFRGIASYGPGSLSTLDPRSHPPRYIHLNDYIEPGQDPT